MRSIGQRRDCLSAPNKISPGKRSDCTMVCIEGNTRLWVYRELHKKGAKGALPAEQLYTTSIIPASSSASCIAIEWVESTKYEIQNLAHAS